MRFDGEGFTLLVENKLHAGYGWDQVERYLKAVDQLPETHRAALIAVTRNVPGYGEPSVHRPGWLGSVRWAKLRDDGLATLLLAEPLASQWRSLLAVMGEQGDLGLTGVDTQLIEAWARYDKGRDHLRDILSQLHDVTLATMREAMLDRYPDKKPEELVKDDRPDSRLGYVRLPFRVPASEADPSLVIEFFSYEDRPHFGVEAMPFDARDLRRNRHGVRQALEDTGWWFNEWTWERSYEPECYLDRDDVPGCLAELLRSDLPNLVNSGIYDHDLDPAG